MADAKAVPSRSATAAANAIEGKGTDGSKISMAQIVSECFVFTPDCGAQEEFDRVVKELLFQIAHFLKDKANIVSAPVLTPRMPRDNERFECRFAFQGFGPIPREQIRDDLRSYIADKFLTLWPLPAAGRGLAESDRLR